MILVTQIRAARAMLNLSQKEVAQRAGIAVATYNNIERGVQKDPRLSTMQAIQDTFEAEGIEFIQEPMGKVGILLKTKKPADGTATILIVDDNKADRTLYKSWLSKVPNKQYHIVEAQDAASGLDAFMESAPDCLILDFMMYGADGFQLLAAFRRESSAIPPIIFVTGMHNDILEESALSQGVQTYLNKQTMNREDLCAAVERALSS